MYVRNFSEGIDVPWQDFFHTTDQAEVERTCSEAGMGCEWTAVAACASARFRRPSRFTRARVRSLFFNQIQLHHVSCLDDGDEGRAAASCSPKRTCRGTSTSEMAHRSRTSVVARIGELYEELCVEPPWEAGDMIVLDNMLVAHARRPFSGERKILVAMAEMVDGKALAPLVDG